MDYLIQYLPKFSMHSANIQTEQLILTSYLEEKKSTYLVLEFLEADFHLKSGIAS